MSFGVVVYGILSIEFPRGKEYIWNAPSRTIAKISLGKMHAIQSIILRCMQSSCSMNHGKNMQYEK